MTVLGGGAKRSSRAAGTVAVVEIRDREARANSSFPPASPWVSAAASSCLNLRRCGLKLMSFYKKGHPCRKAKT